MRTKANSRARARADRATAAAARAGAADRRLAFIALGVAVAATGCIVYVIWPDGAYNQSYQLVTLCLVIAALAGRALIGYRPPEAAPRFPAYLSRLALPAVLLAALLPYLASLRVGLLSDDYTLTAAVARVHGPVQALTTRVFPIFVRNLHVFAWWLQYRLWGMAPVGYHVVSLFFHAANAGLVYALGRRFTGSPLAGLLAGVLFAIHPAHTETVVWASCQPDLQSTLLSLISLLLLDVYLSAGRAGPRRAALGWALAAFALALFSKESAAALPGLAILWVGLRAPRAGRRRVVAVGVWYALVLTAYAVYRVLALQGIGGYPGYASFWNAVFPSQVLRQILTFLFPLNRSLVGLYPGAVLVAVIALTALVFWCGRHLEAVPGRRLGFYLGFVVVASAPMWVLVWPNANLEGTRWGYLPTIGLAWLIGDVCASGALASRRAWKVAAASGLALAAMCAWYLGPWLRADRLAGEILSAGVRMVQGVPTSVTSPVFYVQSLPGPQMGAQVLTRGFQYALSRKLGHEVSVEIISQSGDLPAEALPMLSLQPGEYVYGWNGRTKEMDLLRQSKAGIAPEEQGP